MNSARTVVVYLALLCICRVAAGTLSIREDTHAHIRGLKHAMPLTQPTSEMLSNFKVPTNFH